MAEEMVIFNAKNKEELTHDEIWDDTLLIQQYDAAMEQLQRRLHKRSDATESEQSEAPQEEVLNRDAKAPNQANKKKKNKKNKKRTEWHTGDPCRAKYSEDNVVYEATIIALDPAKASCTVRYVGYNNEETQPLHRLARTHGEKARRTQIKEAECDNVSEASSSVLESDIQTDTDVERSSKRPRPKDSPYSHNEMPAPRMHQSDNSFMPPSHLPMLPPPPALNLGEGGDMDEALHTMLMSWYMAGYHSGYYQGLKTARTPRRH